MPSGVIHTLRIGRAPGDARLALEDAAIAELGVQGDRLAGHGNDAAAYGENAVGLADALLEVARDARSSAAISRLPKAWPAKLEFWTVRGWKSVLQQAVHRRLGVGQGSDAVADVAHRRHAHLVAQLARRSAIVGHGDDRGDVAGLLLEAAQQDRQPGAAADGHDARAARAQPTLVEQLAQRLLADLVGLDERAQEAPRSVGEDRQTDCEQDEDEQLELQRRRCDRR